jgi:hypothetical protein
MALLRARLVPTHDRVAIVFFSPKIGKSVLASPGFEPAWDNPICFWVCYPLFNATDAGPTIPKYACVNLVLSLSNFQGFTNNMRVGGRTTYIAVGKGSSSASGKVACADCAQMRCILLLICGTCLHSERQLHATKSWGTELEYITNWYHGMACACASLLLFASLFW